MAVVCIVFLSGCPSEAPKVDSSASLPLRGQEVEVLAPASLNLPVFWEVLRHEWSSQTGASMKFVEFDGKASADQVGLPAGPGGKLIFFPLNQLCDVEGKFSPLPINDAQIDWKDAFKGLRERILTRDRQPVAFPVSVPLLVCYVRQDLLRAANRSLPETWDDYHELVDSLPAWAPGLVAVEPLSPEFRATTFFARTLAFSKHPENFSVWFDIDSSVPTLNSPGFQAGLEMAQRTWSKLPAEVQEYSPRDCRQQLLSGKAAIGLAWEPTSAELHSHAQADETVKSARVEGIELAICRLPGTRRVFNRNSKKWDTLPSDTVHAPALCGMGGLAVGMILSPESQSESAATNFLLSVTSPMMFDQAFHALPKGPCRESQILSAPTWFGPELSSEEASQYVDVVAQSLRDPQVVYELPVAGADEFRQAAGEALNPLLLGMAGVEATLVNMQKSFEEIVGRIGTEKIRDSYRRGLGMSPPPKK